MYHNPVMVGAAVEGLSVVSGGKYVDVTFGGGGHTRAILKHLGNGLLVAFDQDDDARSNLPDDDRLIFVNHNFRYLQNFLRLHNCIPADGLLADLGVSSHQLDVPERGFSTRQQGPLDMRMNKDAKLTAREIVNEYDAGKLADIFYLYGEIRQSRQIAAGLEKERKTAPLKTTDQFMEVVSKWAPRGKENKFMAQLFQALRIEVNGELDALKEMLEQCKTVIRPGGRLVVISYHSLEDRLVKHFMKTGNFMGRLEQDFYGNPVAPFKMLGKAIQASKQEIAENSRARSAKLRIAEKL